MREDQIESGRDGFTPQPLPVLLRTEGESNLRALSSRRNADANVANQDVGLAVGNANLHPYIFGEQSGVTHFILSGTPQEERSGCP